MEGYIGEIRMFAGSRLPRGWAFCDGALIPINQNTVLFGILGTVFGGNGTSNFALPDMRGRTPANANSAYDGGTNTDEVYNFDLGFKGGKEDKSLKTLHQHTHTITGKLNANNVTTASVITNNPDGNFPGSTGSAIDAEYYKTSNGNYMAADSLEITVNPAGAGKTVTNMQQYFTVSFIICLQGVMPPRP
jgi:microcystin-dependent protein